MAPRSGDEIMVRDSIEAKGDEDVEMEDAPATTNGGAENGSTKAVISAKTDSVTDGQLDADDDVDVDADGEVEDDYVAETKVMGRRGRKKRGPDTPQKRLIQLIDTTSRYLCDYEENGELLAAGFQRLPKRNDMPDYYEVISKPVAFSTVRSHILKKTYSRFSDFVHDIAQICHNAQVYNRPSAPIFSEAVRLREIFKERLEQLVGDGSIEAEEAVLPDLGELPPVDDTPPSDEDQAVQDEDEEEEEEDDEEDDDSDDEGVRRRGRRRGRPSKRDDDDEDYAKKRGRPPKVFTPTEARIHAILKGLRKPRNDDGELRILPFEKLPDKQLNKEYYMAIENPIALDQIKRKAKRKKYRNVDNVLSDLDTMFDNAMRYNEEGSDIYDDAVELQKEAHRLFEQERAKSDEAFRDDEGKLPLSEVERNGEVWKVGDWVHIRNPNDLEKPIVAQICRLWQDEAGRQWINACWYYRPEQTVHRVTKRFYKHEVMKTGQYRGHLVDDIVDRCFVMFHTRYHKGRPRGFPRDKEVYVCEARYNEERYTFNRIKTWTSCLPDEVRERDYEMESFDVPRKLRKEPTPIAHLLKEGAKETDPLPKPNWGHKDAPPVIGGVHIRPREPNDSPSPEPTPEPPVVPPPSMASDPIRRQSAPMPTSASNAFHPGTPGPVHVPSPSPAHAQAQAHAHAHAHAHVHQQFQQSHFVPQQHRPFGYNPSAFPVQPIQHHQPVPSPSPAHATPGTAHFAPHHQQHQQPHHHQQQQQQQQQPHHHQHQHQQQHHQHQQQHPGYHHPQQQQPHFVPSPVSVGHHHQVPNSYHSPHFPHHHVPAVQQPRMPMAPTPSTTAIPHANANAYMPPRTVEVYTLRDADAQIPAEVREQYHTDDKGQVLFFTAPPLNRPHSGIAEESATLGHSVRFLSGLQEHREKRKRAREERDEAERVVRAEKLAKEMQAREQREKDVGAAAGAMFGDWVLALQAQNALLHEEVAPIRAEKAAWLAERSAMNEKAV